MRRGVSGVRFPAREFQCPPAPFVWYDARVLPTSILLRNYRCFSGPEEIELRPITLLFGRNNSGKSALLRSLPLIGDSIATDSVDALELSRRLAPFELDFDSLRRKGRAQGDDHDIGVGLRWPAGTSLSAVDWSIIEEPDWHRLIVSNIQVTISGHPTERFAWRQRRGDERAARLPYNLDSEEGRLAFINFRGLVPHLTIPDQARTLSTVAAELASLKGTVLWLTSLRPAPLRLTRWTGAVRWELSPGGQDAPILLAAEPGLLEDVSSWYERNVGAQLAVEERRREVRTLLRQRFDIDLADTGEGLSQCLPVLTALAMARKEDERGPRILAIEEPEAHLHPKLQRALAERVCEVASGGRARVVMETHSEHILLTIQLAIVRGDLRPEDVVIYWVRNVEQGRSTASKIALDDEGSFIGDWPPSAFDEDRSLAADIIDARESRRSRA